MREKPIACLLRSTAKLGTLEIQTVLPKRSRGAPEVLVWGWPTPIWWNARTELSPERGKPVYGSAAREEVRRIMREAKREGINFGWSTKTSLCKVARGRAAAESFGVGAGASLHEARPQGAEARAGRAGTTSAGPIRCRQGSPARVAARITATRDEAPNPEGHSRPERGKAIGAARRTAVAPQGSPRSPDVICQTQTPAQEPASRSSQCHSGSDSRLVAGIGSFSRGVYSG